MHFVKSFSCTNAFPKFLKNGTLLLRSKKLIAFQVIISVAILLIFGVLGVTVLPFREKLPTAVFTRVDPVESIDWKCVNERISASPNSLSGSQGQDVSYYDNTGGSIGNPLYNDSSRINENLYNGMMDLFLCCAEAEAYIPKVCLEIFTNSEIFFPLSMPNTMRRPSSDQSPPQRLSTNYSSMLSKLTKREMQHVTTITLAKAAHQCTDPPPLAISSTPSPPQALTSRSKRTHLSFTAVPPRPPLIDRIPLTSRDMASTCL